MKYASITLALLAAGCASGPGDEVVDNENMTIYRVTETNGQKGKYSYYVRDKTQGGWEFISDHKFQVGDRLVISKAEETEQDD